MAKLPKLHQKHKVCVICEGYEEKAYIDRLLDLNIWNHYDIIAINAKGALNIPARFQDAFQNNSYEIVLVFCDTDKSSSRTYLPVKQKINAFLGKRKAAEKLIIFANPCTMQIILSHFGDVSLSSQSKRINAPIIEKLTGVKDYDAKDEQIKAICAKIGRRNYADMKRRVESINYEDGITPSTNFIVFLNRFESENTKWISGITRFLTSE